MKKEYIIYKLSDASKEACKIDNELFPMYNVKRGLRNEDGTGVLVGLTKVGNVVGYERLPEGGLSKLLAFIGSTTIVYLPEATFFCPSFRSTRSKAFVPTPDFTSLS